MKVSFYCGCYRAASSLIDEPPECVCEGIIEVDKDDWENEAVCIFCPKCGAELHQSMEHFEEIKN